MASRQTRPRMRLRRFRTLLIALLPAVLCAAAVGLGVRLAEAPGAHPIGPSTHAAVASGQAPQAPVTARGSAAAVVASAPSGRCVRVPILVYHYIRLDTDRIDELGWQLSVSPDDFQAQMDWLRLAGGHPVTLAQVMRSVEHGAPLPAHPVVLTFDDGYADFATIAAPILARNGFVATDYVVAGFFGRGAYMTRAQVQQVAAMGMVIGAHTMHHVDLTALPLSLAAIEISASRQVLQQLLRQPVADFAYPYGDVDAAVAALVSRAGFADAVTLAEGTAQCAGQRYELPRLRVVGADSLSTFAAKAGVPAPPAAWLDPLVPGQLRLHALAL